MRWRHPTFVIAMFFICMMLLASEHERPRPPIVWTGQPFPNHVSQPPVHGYSALDYVDTIFQAHNLPVGINGYAGVVILARDHEPMTYQTIWPGNSPIVALISDVEATISYGQIVPAPGIHVSDNAGLLSQEHAGSMATISQDLAQQTGIHLMVVTLPSGDLPGEDAAEIFRTFELLHGGRGVLLLYVHQPMAIVVHAGSELQGWFNDPQVVLFEDDIVGVVEGDAYQAMLSLYIMLASNLYELSRVEPPGHISELLRRGLEPPHEASPHQPFMAFMFVIFVLLAAWRIVSLTRRRVDRVRSQYMGSSDHDYGTYKTPHGITRGVFRTEDKRETYKVNRDVYLDHDDNP